MENGSLVGLSRQIALQRELDVVANNIANINTTGFKADGIIFHEHLMPTARANQFRGNDRAMSFVQDRATWLDLSQGAIKQTGNPLDVAVSGDAYLVVQTPKGERYTRNGAFQISATGQLVNSEGMPVMGQGGPIVFQPDDHSISIGNDGTISVREGVNTTDSQRGKLKFASFDEPHRLQKEGSSNFMAPNDLTPQTPTTVRVNQGVVESSNVKSVVEMTRMVEVTRTYTLVAGMLQQQSDLRRSAIGKLAEVPTS